MGDYMVTDYEDCVNTTDPTGRYIHEPKWVEFLIELGLRPLFLTGDTGDEKTACIRWYPVEILEGRWPDTLDEGTTHVGYSHNNRRGPSGHFYGWLAVGDPRHGGEASCCTQLEEGTRLGLVECDLDGTRFVGTVISKHVEGGSTYYDVRVDYEHSESPKEEIDVHRNQNAAEGVIGVNAYEAKAINNLPSETLVVTERLKQELADRFLSFARMARVGDHMAATEITNEIRIDFGLARAGDEVHCAICGLPFEDGQRVFRVVEGGWNSDGPNFEPAGVDEQQQAFVHASCVER